MSTKSKNHRMSDGGVQKAVGKGTGITDAKRRQTIADITTKENATATAGNVTSVRKSVAPTQKLTSMSSPFKHHHNPVSLGAAASYYFKGVPQTPVQKLIKSEQQKLLLQASMQVEDEENTAISTLANQSYLSSSSSSSDGRNSSREDETMGLNASVLSDTTELTASNFLVLAATHRTTAEEWMKAAQVQRQPLSTLTTTTNESKEELVATSAHGGKKSKRRQSVSEGIIVEKPMEEKSAGLRRRETMATVPLPRAAASPIEIPAMSSKTRNKVADYQPRLFDSSFTSNATAQRRRSSVAPHRDSDSTTELSISSSDMKNLLRRSSFGTPIMEDSTVMAVDASEMIEDVSSPAGKSQTSVASSHKSPPSKSNPAIDTSAMSPARNTRSAAKKAAAEQPNMVQESESTALFQSPSKPSRRRTPTKSPQAKSNDLTLENRMHLSPAKNTRSATKMRSVESEADDMSFHRDLSLTEDTTGKVSLLLNALEPTGSLINESTNGNTTASLGDLLDEMNSADNSRLDTSVTPTARNTRSAHKERTSISTVYDALASSPARNTRSAHSKNSAKSPSRDDTAQLLLDLAAGAYEQSSAVDLTSSSHASNPTSNASTTSEVDLLNDLVEQYSTQKSVKNGGDGKMVDVSQDSTISLNDLLVEYLPQSQTQPVDGVVYDGDKSSAASSSRMLRSAVSKASTIDTPPGLADCDSYSGLGVRDAPNSPPSTIRFPVVEDSFVHMTTSVGRSPLRKSLTPSRLAPSPRRFIHSVSQKKSPYRSALTPSRLPASPYRLSNPRNAITGNRGAYGKSLTPTQLHASPARPKRSIDTSNEIDPTSAVKRQKTFDELQGLAKKSLSTTTSGSVNLQSALRRPGHGSVRSGMKRVAFGSPTFAEFNKLSPAENVTPMIVRRPSFSDKMYDDTAEIEVDMQSLMESYPSNIQGAGRTPGAKSNLQRMDCIDDSNMSVDSTTLPVASNEPTMTLESDMFSLLNNAALVEKQSVPPVDMECVDEDTIELETDINALLNDPSPAIEESTQVGRRSIIFDHEPTVELESDINLLLAEDNVSEQQPPIESHRFSIAPSRRLSVSIDGSFDHSKLDDSAVITLPQNDELYEDEVSTLSSTFNLKVDEIVDFSLLQSLVVPNEKDFLFEVERSMRENGISDTMSAFMSQVLQTIESQTAPGVEPDSVVEFDDDDASLSMALQRFVRDVNKEDPTEIKELISSLFDIDKFEWRAWLVSAVEGLSRPLDEKSIELVDEIKHLDQLCIDIEQNLALVANKSVQKARKKDTNKRMVR